MRIRIVQKPSLADVDGMELRHFLLDCEYVVGNRLGSLLLAEGWAEPVADDDPALVIPVKHISGFKPHFNNPAHSPKPASVAADGARKRRRATHK